MVKKGWKAAQGGAEHWVIDLKYLDDQLRFLRRMVMEFRSNPAIRDLALKIIRDAGCPPKDKVLQALAIATYVQNNVFYVQELPERFQNPFETLDKKAGDCDDFTTTIASLNESLGIPTLFIVMSIDGSWKHIFPACYASKAGLLTLDATLNQTIYERINPVAIAMKYGHKVLLKVA